MKVMVMDGVTLKPLPVFIMEGRLARGHFRHHTPSPHLPNLIPHLKPHTSTSVASHYLNSTQSLISPRPHTSPNSFSHLTPLPRNHTHTSPRNPLNPHSLTPLPRNPHTSQPLTPLPQPPHLLRNPSYLTPHNLSPPPPTHSPPQPHTSPLTSHLSPQPLTYLTPLPRNPSYSHPPPPPQPLIPHSLTPLPATPHTPSPHTSHLPHEPL
nr:extensin-like [Penaeus vannamei]